MNHPVIFRHEHKGHRLPDGKTEQETAPAAFIQNNDPNLNSILARFNFAKPERRV